ncbi:class I SAM-dependent methyltransferase [Streptomyces abikoensis]|uniref:class I SAM-dependent methyltransferase n=1 Tax=Streptomyces abikoensis TaxID=97398 RepID=UPI00167583D3|nr:class I SAM-dependent methyltransferase [Streptomyces abikoensis]GGP51249.1 putative polyketide synthase protein [Streptomyces abikoensis]
MSAEGTPGTAAPVRLTGVQETLLAPLYVRAQDNRSPRPVLGDTTAEGLMRRLDYDWRKMKFAGRDRRTVPFRAKKLDEWANAFLAEHPDAVVLHLACGLDSRAFRLDVPDTALWFDVDLPDVIELRRKLYDETDGYRMLAASAVEAGWLEAVPKDRPALVVAEGLAPYLAEADGLAMLRNLTGHLSGGVIMFDAVLPWTRHIAKYARLVRQTGASFGWAVADPRDLERSVPGLRALDEWSMCDSPYADRLPVQDRFIVRVMRSVRPLRYAYRLLRYRF